MDRTNLLEALRKRNNLSQEEVFEKMGFYGYGRTSKNISKYETGEQQMPFLTAIMYAQSVGATLDEMAYLLYPEQPYHDIHGKSSAMSNESKSKRYNKINPKDHTCIIGTHMDGVDNKAIVPAFNKAIEKGESIFYFGDAQLVRQIADEHPEYEVHYSKYPYSELSILPEKTSIEDITLFINHIGDLSEGLGVGDAYFRDINKQVLYRVMINMIKKGKDISLLTIIEELNHLDTCDYFEDEDCKMLFMQSRGLRNFLTYLYINNRVDHLNDNDGSADKVFADDICKKKHIVIADAYPIEKESAINVTLMFMQYCKKINEYHMKTNIILEETGLFLKHIPYGELVEHLRNDEIYDTWTIAIPSIEVLQSIYGGDVSELMLRFPNIQTTLRHMSMNTEKYLSSVMDDTLKLDDKEFISIKRMNGIPYREEK